MVTGVKVNLSPGEPMFCKSYIYAKATCKPLVKIYEGEHSKEFTGEVHTNLWDQHLFLPSMSNITTSVSLIIK
jgi:hypothetical protein